MDEHLQEPESGSKKETGAAPSRSQAVADMRRRLGIEKKVPARKGERISAADKPVRPNGSNEGKRYKPARGFVFWLTSNPPRLITLSFALVILTGAFLLTLPIASASGESVGFLRALFTSTSCTCVTGLIVGDTATLWSGFGHVVLILLIQIGGLGLITIMSFFMLATRRKIGMRTMLAMQESVGSESFASSRALVKKIIFITLSCELTGGLILTWRYAARMPFGDALRRGMFQGISAFCNAV